MLLRGPIAKLGSFKLLSLGQVRGTFNLLNTLPFICASFAGSDLSSINVCYQNAVPDNTYNLRMQITVRPIKFCPRRLNRSSEERRKEGKKERK